MRSVFLLLAAAIVSTTATARPLRAHMWYPMECCSHNHCRAAEGFALNARGDTMVIVESRRFLVPPDLKRRPSPDDRIHVCLHYDEFGVQYPHCLFVPYAPRVAALRE